MGLKDAKYSQQVDGQPSYIELAFVADGAKPTAMEIELDGAAAAGDVQITTQPLPDDIPMGAIIVFSTETVIVSEAASKNDTTLKIESIDGLDGEGVKGIIADKAKGEWNRLYRDLRSQDIDFQRNPSVARRGSVVHGPKSGPVSVQEPIVQSIAPTSNRSGEFWYPSEIVDQLEKYGDSNSVFWVRQVTPDADGEDALVREGPALITNVVRGNPADGVVTIAYVVQWKTAAREVAVGAGTP